MNPSAANALLKLCRRLVPHRGKPGKVLRALVVGGGIAGIQAALDLANARIPVTIVEKSPSLGGRMAQLDKTFPTMDCAI